MSTDRKHQQGPAQMYSKPTAIPSTGTSADNLTLVLLVIHDRANGKAQYVEARHLFRGIVVAFLEGVYTFW